VKTFTDINVKVVYLPKNAEITLETPRTPLFTYTSIKLPCFCWTKPLKIQRKGCWCGRNSITKNLLVRFEWVKSHIGMSQVIHMNESCHTYEWVMSHIWMSHVVLMNESWHTYERVKEHIWTIHATYMSHGTHVHESWHTYERVR